MRFQKGQSVVEFAIVLPFFLVILWGIFYAAFLFTDYLSLTNLARSTAREASLEAMSIDDSKKQTVYDKVLDDAIQKYKPNLNTNLYEIDLEKNMTIEPVYENTKIKNVKVTITATLNKNSTLGRVFSNFLSAKHDPKDPHDHKGTVDDYVIEYQMYQERN